MLEPSGVATSVRVMMMPKLARLAGSAMNSRYARASRLRSTLRWYLTSTGTR